MMLALDAGTWQKLYKGITNIHIKKTLVDGDISCFLYFLRVEISIFLINRNKEDNSR